MLPSVVFKDAVDLMIVGNSFSVATRSRDRVTEVCAANSVGLPIRGSIWAVTSAKGTKIFLTVACIIIMFASTHVSANAMYNKKFPLAM